MSRAARGVSRIGSTDNARVDLRQILVAYELDAICENDVVEWAGQQLALELCSDVPAVADLASLDPRQADEVRTTLRRVHEAVDPEFKVRSREGEAIARNLLCGLAVRYLTRQIRPRELCRLVTPIEDAYDFPAWLGDLYNVCDWVEPETTIEDVAHLTSAVAALHAAEEERVWSRLERWLTSVLLRHMSKAVTHLYLFLYETTATFAIQVTGESVLPSGPVAPVFTTGADSFHIDRLFVADDWQHALDLSTRLARRYLAEGQERDGIASVVTEIGFVDGDLTRIWPEPR